jgi:hypothetical protein
MEPQPPAGANPVAEDSMTYGIIYKATGPGGRVYIGQTMRRLEDRKNQHIRQSSRPGNGFHIALREHGPDSFTWEEIDRAGTRQELNDKEVYWIAFCHATDPAYGYNSGPGGSGDTGYSQRGREKSEEHKQKIAAGAKTGQMKRFEQHNREKAERIERKRKEKEAARLLAESLKPPKKTPGEISELTRIRSLERWADPLFREHMRAVARQNMGEEQKEKMRITRRDRAEAGDKPRADGKLTVDDVKRIKRLIAEGIPCSQIAGEYGISASYIRYIRAGKRWGWVA